MQIFIAGANRTSDVKIEGFDIEQALGHEQDTCSFVVKSGDKPIEGQEIIIESNGVRLFGGIITNPKEDEKTPTKVFYSCEAVDYGYQFDKRLVVEVYENMPADEIALDIISKYCPDFTGNGIVSGAPTVEYIKFDYLRPSECFRQLAEYVGWKWKIDYYKDVKFFKQYNAFAPMEININSPIRKLKHEPDIQGLRNRVYVLGGKMLSDEQDFAYVADGQQRLWVLGHEPHSPWVYIGDISNPPTKPGLEYVDDETDYTWMYNQREKYVRCSAQTATPAQGTTVIFRYKAPMDVITMVEDLASQQAIAAIQGGDGVYEHKIVDDSLITVEAAEAAGQADLAEHANPKINGSFETNTAIEFWQPGQLLTIALPERGIQGQYVIQKVNISSLSDGKLTCKITYSGNLKGIPDLLQALVSGQQQKKIADVNYQSKFVSGDENIAILDSVDIAPRTTPWYAGDPDAIAGEIVALGVT